MHVRDQLADPVPGRKECIGVRIGQQRASSKTQDPKVRISSIVCCSLFLVATLRSVGPQQSSALMRENARLCENSGKEVSVTSAFFVELGSFVF